MGYEMSYSEPSNTLSPCSSCRVMYYDHELFWPNRGGLQWLCESCMNKRKERIVRI